MFLRRATLLKEKITDFNTYPFSVLPIREMDTLEFTGEVTFFVGENGSGKSTLLEAIAYQCGFNTAGGGRNNNHDVDSSETALGDYIRLFFWDIRTQRFLVLILHQLKVSGMKIRSIIKSQRDLLIEERGI